MQQINLYHTQELPKPVILTFVNMLRAGIIAILLFVLISLYQIYCYFIIKKEFNTLNKKEKELVLHIEEEKAQLIDPQTKKILLKEIEFFENKNKILRKMQSKLDTFNLDIEQQGFSKYLLAFSNYIVPGMWLTDIHICSEEGFYLSGKTTDDVNVTKFLSRLSSNEVFKNKTFKNFKLTEDQENNLISFTIGSEM